MGDLKCRKLVLVGNLPRQMKKYPAMKWQQRKKFASIGPNAQNLILICTFIMLIIEHTMIHMIFSSGKKLFAFFRLRWMLFSLLNIRASVTGAIVHATKKLNFLLNFLTQWLGMHIRKLRRFYLCFFCKTINTVNFNKVFNKGMVNLIYQKIMNENMGIKESRNVYIT